MVSILLCCVCVCVCEGGRLTHCDGQIGGKVN